ncbi:MAG: nitrilase-related carbon-nitrogen hydrolase, partial [Bacteriovoracaceae bacterium]
MKLHIHQTHHAIADFTNFFSALEEVLQSGEAGAHIFPELFMSGYPLQDLCLQKPYIERHEKFLNELNQLVVKNERKDMLILAGGVRYELTTQALPLRLSNVVYRLEPGKTIEAVYAKQLLPNYDIFDEMKYFTPGSESSVLEWKGKFFGLLVCEDMWSSSFHHKDPVMDLKKKIDKDGVKLDALINLSASPYVVNKDSKRKERSRFISNLFNAPYIYVNKVGGEDEILFDGRSFVMAGNDLALELARFKADQETFHLGDKKIEYEKELAPQEENTWEELFSARIAPSSPKLKELSDSECEEVLEAVCFGVQEYALKNGFNRFTVALSGGMDSSLVLTLLRLSLKEGQYLEAIYMPSVHSSPLSHECCLDLCQNLGVPFKSLPIKFMHSTAKNLFSQTFSQPFEGLVDENIQSRLRGTLLYTRS